MSTGMAMPQWISKYPRLNSALGLLFLAQGVWALLSKKPLLLAVADWFGWAIMNSAPYLFYISLSLGAFGLFLLVAIFVNTTPTLKRWVLRNNALTPALPNDPHVIFSVSDSKPRTWHLSNSNANAFNITLARIGTSDLYAQADDIQEIKANQSIQVNFSVDDIKTQEKIARTPWLDIVFVGPASKAYPVCISYNDASGQKFRSEATIIWDNTKNEWKVVHGRIVRVSS
jgi:hypothetical protein